jgi:hypothetical protein
LNKISHQIARATATFRAIQLEKMLSAFAALTLGLVLPTTPIRAPVAARRVTSPVALLDATELLATVTTLPADFQDLMPERHGHRFSDVMMMATGSYVLLSGACTFLPRVTSILTGKNDPAHRIASFLDSVPESKFGWLQADLRSPLPEIDGLDSFPIGVHAGRKVYLCNTDAAIDFVTNAQKGHVELSPDFTKHYGERVFVIYNYD